MNHPSPLRSLAACAALCSTAAMAHITLPAGGAAAGSDYDAAFRVGHACSDAKATTGVRVQLPTGFTLIQAQPRVMFQVKDDEGVFRQRFPDGVDELYFVAFGVVRDVDRLHALFNLFAATLQRLCEIGSAYEQHPGVTI